MYATCASYRSRRLLENVQSGAKGFLVLVTILEKFENKSIIRLYYYQNFYFLVN